MPKLVDAEIAAAMAKAAASAKTKTIDIFGEPFEITTDVNQWLVTRMLGGDIGATAELLQSLIVRKADAPGLSGRALMEAQNEDALNQQRLNRILGAQRGLDDAVLIALIGRMVGIVADRPTKPSSGSSPSRTSTDD